MKNRYTIGMDRMHFFDDNRSKSKKFGSAEPDSQDNLELLYQPNIAKCTKEPSNTNYLSFCSHRPVRHGKETTGYHKKGVKPPKMLSDHHSSGKAFYK
uniref:Uncharacterized protein n=1 Tax=Romanomermis culicivorax TaxID=13658 RepID=A0A915HR99_ROMCU